MDKARIQGGYGPALSPGLGQEGRPSEASMSHAYALASGAATFIHSAAAEGMSDGHRRQYLRAAQNMMMDAIKITGGKL